MPALPELCSVAAELFPSGHTPAHARAVRRVNPLEHAGWDALLLTHPEYSFFHSAAWARVLRETYDFEPTCFLVSEHRRLLALLPIMEVNSWLTGRRGVSLPFTDDCPLLDDQQHAALKDRLIPEVIRHGRVRRWKYLECRGGRNHFDGAPASDSFLGHELRLVDEEQRLFDRCEGTVRRAIRKAENLGVTIEFSGTFEAVRTFYWLHCQTRRKHGLPPQSLSFFRNVHRHVISEGLGMVVVARYQGAPVAAAVFFHLGTKAVFKYGASAVAFQHLRANNLVMWEAIKWYARGGYSSLDFGRTAISSQGLRRFKRAWGARERRLDYVRLDLEQDRFVPGKDRTRGWYNRLFNLLPTTLSRMIGAALYRHVG